MLVVTIWWKHTWCSLCVGVCMLTVSNALLMSSATVIVRSGGLFWLKPVDMVLFMLCIAVLVELLLLKPCCVLLSLREVRWVCMMCLCSCVCLVLELV